MPSSDKSEDWWRSVQAAAEAALPRFLLRQRWFPAKDSGPPQVSLVFLQPFPCEGMRAAIALWRVLPARGQSFVMFVPMATVPADVADDADVIASITARPIAWTGPARVCWQNGRSK
jgi:hypothetical protein